MEQVGVVILNYIKYKDTINLVNCLLKQEGVNLKIVIVDNNSPNESYIKLLDYGFPVNVVIIKNSSNTGYAAGNNVGLKYLLKEDIKWVLIMNPDTYFVKVDAISTMIDDAYSVKRLGIIGPQIIDTKGKAIMPYFLHPNLITLLIEDYLRLLMYPFWNLVLRHIIKKPVKVFRVYGCCMLGPIDLWNRVNFFDEDTFLYWEETILSYKLMEIGYYTYYTPRTQVIHAHAEESFNDKNMVYNIESLNYFLNRYLKYNIRLNKLIISKTKFNQLLKDHLKRLFVVK